MSSPKFLRDARFVFDLASHLKDKYNRLTFDAALSTQDFTLSSGTEVERAVQQFDGTTRVLADEFPTFISNTSTMTLLHEGNDTAFDQTYMSFVDSDVIVHAVDFNFAAALNVSAYTSDNFAIDSVDITMQSFRAPGQLAWSQKFNVPSTLANMTGVDNQYLIVNYSYFTPFPIYAGGMFGVQIQINETTGTGTRQVGILTAFPYQGNATLRELTPSGFRMHFHPLPSHAGVITKGGFADYVSDPPSLIDEPLPPRGPRYGGNRGGASPNVSTPIIDRLRNFTRGLNSE